MDGFATVLLMGRVGGEPEVGELPANSTKPAIPVLRFSVAVNRWAPGADGGKGSARTSWFNCSIWGRDAQYLGRTMSKGDWVSVSGQLEVRTYQRSDGTRGTAVEVRGDKVVSVRAFGGQPRGSRVEGGTANRGSGTQSAAPDPDEIFPPPPKDGEDEMPF